MMLESSLLSCGSPKSIFAWYCMVTLDFNFAVSYCQLVNRSSDSKSNFQNFHYDHFTAVTLNMISSILNQFLVFCLVQSIWLLGKLEIVRPPAGCMSYKQRSKSCKLQVQELSQKIKLTSKELRRIEREKETEIKEVTIKRRKNKSKETKKELREIKIGGFGLVED